MEIYIWLGCLTILLLLYHAPIVIDKYCHFLEQRARMEQEVCRLRQWKNSPEGILSTAKFSAQVLLDNRAALREQREAFLNVQLALAADWKFEDMDLTREDYQKFRQRLLGDKIKRYGVP